MKNLQRSPLGLSFPLHGPVGGVGADGTSCLSLCALRRDAPAAAQGLREGGGQEPGVGRLRTAEAPAVRVTAKAD